MVRSRRSVSKEDISSVHTDSGVSLSSPPSAATVDDVEEKISSTKKKQKSRRACSTKATKRLHKSKKTSVFANKVLNEKKFDNGKSPVSSEIQLDDNLTNSNVTVLLVGGEDAISLSKNQSQDLEAQLPFAETNSNVTVEIINPINIANNAAIITTTLSEKSISFVDSAFSETDVTQSATDFTDITHTSSSNNGTSAVDNLTSNDVPSPLSLDAKRTRKSYRCHVCCKEFRGNNDLRRHLLIHSDERPYKCDQCGKCYRQAVNLRNHVTAAHEGQRQFACPQCPKVFALKERLRLHMRLHSGEKPYACTMCEKRFARGGQLQQHIISHHKGSTKQHVCDKCSTAFSSPSNLRAHMDHYCEICKEHFPNEPTLRAHINELHYKLGQFDCEICKKTIEDDDLAKHLKTHTNVKTHVCEVCNLYFMQKSQFNVHMRMHTGERPYQCRICWQTYAHSSVLKLHIRKHTGEKPFQCLICKDVVAFSQLAHMKTHMKKIHRQINPYMCEGCQQFFKVKVELQAHMRQCEHCNVDVEKENAKNNDMQVLSHLRFLMALLLKKISTQEKLKQLGYEKRLIDNVVVASLKLANRKACEDQDLPAIERMRRNVEEFLNWIVPAKAMETFRQEQQSVENILDKIVTMYMKH